MKELPEGWKVLPMSSIAEIVGGSTPKTSVPEYWGGDIPWITPNDLSGYSNKYIDRGERSITAAGYESCSTRMVPLGTVLFTSRAPIGYVAIASAPMSTNQGFKSFVPSERVSSDYLYWYLKHATPMISEMASGTTFPEISGKVAKSIPVVVAPEHEQQRIVEAIEEQFSRLDAGVESLQRANSRLAKLRATILNWAVEGRLSVSKGTSWEPITIREIATRIDYGTSAKAVQARPDGVPVLRMGNIRDGRIVLDDLKYLPSDHQDVVRLELSAGDLLFNRTNSPELVVRR